MLKFLYWLKSVSTLNELVMKDFYFLIVGFLTFWRVYSLLVNPERKSTDNCVYNNWKKFLLQMCPTLGYLKPIANVYIENEFVEGLFFNNT